MKNNDLQEMNCDSLRAERMRCVEFRESKLAAVREGLPTEALPTEILPLGAPGQSTFCAAEGLLLRKREFDIVEERITAIDKLLEKCR